jgi:hypothetical protein
MLPLPVNVLDNASDRRLFSRFPDTQKPTKTQKKFIDMWRIEQYTNTQLFEYCLSGRIAAGILKIGGSYASWMIPTQVTSLDFEPSTGRNCEFLAL